MGNHSITWQANRPIDINDLKQGADLVNCVCGSIGQPITVNKTGQVNVIDLQGRAEPLHFGYPPQTFIDGLPPTARKAIRERGVARDGWLSLSGQGTGVIDPGACFHAFSVRLFFAFLRHANEGFSALEADKQLLPLYIDWDVIESTGAELAEYREQLDYGLWMRWFTKESRTRLILDPSNNSDEFFW